MRSDVIAGVLAGAAGTTALNAMTYLDMVLRGRPTSSTPEETVRKVEESTPISLSSGGPDNDVAANRRSGLGALLGIVSGVGTGALYGLVRSRWGRDLPLPLLVLGAGLGANAGTTAPMAAMGVSDPRTWSASSWMSDIVPHLAYGAVTTLAFEAMSPARRRRLELVART